MTYDPTKPSILAGYDLKDSGQRQKFETGSQRDTRKGKGRFDLFSPVSLRRVAGVFERGAEKYEPRNWEKGQPFCRYIDSALRHINDYVEGRRDEDHLAQAAWNILALIHTEEMVRRGLLPAELDDLPNYLPPETNTSEEAS